MHLKQLHVVGFKSFADKSKLDFEPGLMAVVGPNGCGKSNIIDAFRWCLGEMSAKSLRSSLMMDVVFNGSGSRPPQNMAEVTLIFDNEDRRLPINYSEVSISRRLFRSGESEYFINKVQCRLRDIKELFLDTGMGEDGYSSMEQGKVEWVLQAKPEQRRELFEEAAGVSKYRARREEALRKLNRVEIDLSRISDIVSVTRDQIRKLENAVTRAQTYERIKEELKNLEISDWLFQKDNVGVELSKLAETMAALSQEHERLNTDQHQLEALLAENRRKMTETEEELLQANSVLSAIDADIKIGEERLSGAQRRQNELGQQLDTLKESIQRESNRIEELKNREQTQEQSLLEFRKSGEGVEETFRAAQTACQEALSRLEEKRLEIKQSRDALLAKGQRRIQVQKDLSEKSSSFTRKESLIENTEKEIQKSVAHLEEVQQQAERLTAQKDDWKSKLDDASQKLNGLTGRIDESKNQEAASKNKHLALAEEIATLEGRIHSIQEQQDKDPYLSGTKFLLETSLPGISGPVSQLIQCSDQDRDLVSAALGEHLSDLVADTVQDAENAVKELSSQNKGRARIWILEKMGGFLSNFGEEGDLLGKIQVEDKFRPLIKKLAGKNKITGATIYSEAMINGGVDPSRWQTHSAMRLSELQDQLKGKENDKQALEQEIESQVSELKSLAEARETTLKELEETRIRFEMTDEEWGRAEGRKQEIEDHIQKIRAELTQIQSELGTLKGEQEALQTELDAIHGQEKEEHERLDIQQHELTELQTKHSEANADLSTKQEQHSSYQEKLTWNQSVLDHTKTEIQNLQNSVSRHEQTIGNLENEQTLAQKAQEEAQNLIQSSLEKRRGAAEKVSDIQSIRLGISNEIEEKDKALTGLRASLNEVSEKIQNGRIEEHDLKNRETVLSQKLQEQYELTFEQAAQTFEKVQADYEKLDKLKKRVANMGPINLAAPQEHAELVEKNTFLETQQGDLIKAKDDLKQVINKINATTKEHFRETFDKVRANFRTLYSQLFRGGEADLQLTNEADILNSGVDIYCQPPGKKVMHISLLSGGEKALTACALLFAFFQVRPSPVALLDEVDAPLDEANVVRYVEMVKAFSEKTQFLVITHNKRTMEAANTMYGVTMEELGVSKVLSARLAKSKAEKEPVAETESATA